MRTFALSDGMQLVRIFVFEESDVSTNLADGESSPLARSSQLSHADKMKVAIDKLESKRTNKLIKKRIIGRVSDKKPDLASELINIKSRSVNFKWHLGNKIGENSCYFVCTFYNSMLLIFCLICFQSNLKKLRK